MAARRPRRAGPRAAHCPLFISIVRPRPFNDQARPIEESTAQAHHSESVDTSCEGPSHLHASLGLYYGNQDMNDKVSTTRSEASEYHPRPRYQSSC
jgi:hypothetical protein